MKDARRLAGLTQSELAERAGTSQAAISAYESGAKQPTVATLDRLLAAAGRWLESRGAQASGAKSSQEMEERGRRLSEVLALAEALPARRRGELRYPHLSTLTGGSRKAQR